MRKTAEGCCDPVNKLKQVMIHISKQTQDIFGLLTSEIQIISSRLTSRCPISSLEELFMEVDGKQLLWTYI